MTRGTELTPEEVAAALAEAKARGLPDGWKVSLDKRKRRKWISPSGRTCDSIPKALVISVEMGLLPADTKLPEKTPKRKRGRPPKKKPRKPTLDLTIDEDAIVSPRTAASRKKKKQQQYSDDDNDEEEEESMEPPTNPETALDPNQSHLTTVHWDPNSGPGNKIGWKIRVNDDKAADWKEGRVVFYDPCTHKHKIEFVDNTRSTDRVDEDNCAWLHLRMEDGVQMATKIVWAHVKGYAWWPAMVMESDVHSVRDGYVSVEFFGSSEVATLRNSPECLRPFEHGKVDDIISKNKKKRNASAIALATEEEEIIQNTRNEAAKLYAEKAWGMANTMGTNHNWLGARVQLFRSDVNYPYGDTVAGRVRQYSASQKKWLVSFEVSETMRKKYDASWINLASKEHKLRILDKAPKPNQLSDIDIAPYVVGFEAPRKPESNPREHTPSYLAKVLKERCKGCVDFWHSGDTKVTCNVCKGSFHLGCCDPPLTPEAFKKIGDNGYTCSRCVPCRGCYQKDICTGSHRQNRPPTLTFPEDEDLMLCSMCVKSYEQRQFCPNCAHSWDDDHFQCVQRQIRWQQAHRPKKRGRKRKNPDDPNSPHPSDMYTFTAPDTVPNEDPFPEHALVNPTWYHAETAQWGYTEVDMLTCDSCKLWVHAGCAGLNEEEYEQTSNGDHPIFSKEFLCRVCCRKRCVDIIQKLQQHDSMMLFAEPVSDKVAPNYHDVIKKPMDLQTMLARAERDEYNSYAWVREMFDLMVLNALTFNRFHTTFWKEAQRFHKVCLTGVWKSIGKAAPPGQYDEAIQKNLENAKKAKKMEEDRVQEDKSTEKKDLVAGAKVATIKLPDLRENPPDHPSCLPFQEVKLRQTDAYFSGWMDSCFTCGSSGASDTMLFCVDCGEAFHSFCVNAPIHSMDISSAAGWRCPNCKICEISGEAPQDELKMLFCEMCDRGFSLDLLDPPLSTAPEGLWICGQCVDCHKCKNVYEPRGASLTYWSRDPHLCYRCGGCDGLVDQKKCPVCNGVWRDDDTDLAQCVDCDIKVHSRCDSRAFAHLKKLEKGPKKYRCPSCSKKRGIKKDPGQITRGHMHQLALKAISHGALVPGENCSRTELHEKLMDQIDWKTRNLWRDEYRRVVLEGVRFLNMAKERFGDPRYLMDCFWRENVDLPSWMGQRATRFIHIAKKLKLDTLGFSARRVETCVLISKLAASWLKVACRTMGLKTKKSVKGYDRVMKLLVAPHECGAVEMALDAIRCERNRNIINKDEWLDKFEPKLNAAIQSAVFAGSEVKSEKNAQNKQEGKRHLYELAAPLCGWNSLLEEKDSSHKWRDPRECCLCHLCGDDDAGLQDDEPKRTTDPTKPAIPRLGRLLPMGDGLWVHASCALWSSETWEAPSGGLVHAMEKARSRGSQLRCFGCGKAGATVGCIKANCASNFHFACAYACGAVFTSSKEMYCAAHKDCTEDIVQNPSIELMKTLIVAPEKSKPLSDKDAADNAESLCSRVGALVVHSFGEIEQERDGFHSKDYITPPGYVATRIFWSSIKPKTRTAYVLKIEKTSVGKPLFTITPGDNPVAKIKASSATQAYNILMERVTEANANHFSHGDLFSKLPTERKSRAKVFGMHGPQFFGFGLNHVRKSLENLPGVEAVVAPINDMSPQYMFCYSQPSEDSVVDLQRRRAAAAAEKKLENSSGCARTEGMKAVTQSGGSDRITRALVRRATDEETPGVFKKKVDAEKDQADSRTQEKYREMKSVPIEQRLVAKRSHIHGWGLFTKIDLPKNSMIVEYMGESVRQCVADKREKQYEISGEGSCYMFRLDLQRIVDATMIGCMARFMNHCCQPNAYAKVITVDTENGAEKKIMVFSLKEIKAGEEITYDYKFPVEDGSLKCTCGAPNCIGRLN